MSSNIIYYEFIPLDTLYFRDALPSEIGEDHGAGLIFPPMPDTIAGAVCSKLFREDNNNYKNDDKKNKYEEIRKKIKIVGPFFKKNNELYIPAPYSWFTTGSKKGDNTEKEYEIYKGKKLSEFGDFSNFIYSSHNKDIIWVKPVSSEMKSIGGMWIKFNDFKNINNNDNSGDYKLYSSGYFYKEESHTGIARDLKGNVREGCLYTFKHIRLESDVSIVFGLVIDDNNITFDNNGTLKLGAEQRMGRYKKIDNINLQFANKTNSNNNKLYMSVSVMDCDKGKDSIIATGKIYYIGGWDMAKGFHKPMKGYYPAGSVFTTMVDDYMIELN